MVRAEHRRAAIVLAVTAGLLSGCLDQPVASGVDADGLPLGPVKYKDITNHPEAHLTYPGATVIGDRGSDERVVRVNYRDSAFGGEILASQDTPTQIYDWYRKWLTTHGWSSCDMVRTLTQISAQGYCRGRRERFVVAVDNPRFLWETTGWTLPDANTIFETTYVITPADHGSPAGSPGAIGTASPMPTATSSP